MNDLERRRIIKYTYICTKEGCGACYWWCYWHIVSFVGVPAMPCGHVWNYLRYDHHYLEHDEYLALKWKDASTNI